MKEYEHYYWLLDQRFDFLIPWFQTHFGIKERKNITFVGSFHGPCRRGEEWEGVTKELVGKSSSGEPIYIGQDADSAEAQWLEPEEINQAYKDKIEKGSFVVAFSGVGLPDSTDSFILTGETAAKLNNKWEQYLLLTEKKEIILEKNNIDERRKELKEQLGKTSCPIMVGLSANPGSCRMAVIPDKDLDVIDRYCKSLSENDLNGRFFESVYVPTSDRSRSYEIILEDTDKNKEKLKEIIINHFRSTSDLKIIITDKKTNYTTIVSNTEDDINWFCKVWEIGQYPNHLLIRKCENAKIITPETIRVELKEDEVEESKEVLKKAVLSMQSSCKCGKVVIKKTDLSGGNRMQWIAKDCDLEDYCRFLDEEELKGEFLISKYISHKQSFAGIGIISNDKDKKEVHYCGTTEQVLYHELAYEGLIWPPFWNIESNKSIQTRKKEIIRVTRKIGEMLAKQGYFGFYSVDFVEEEKTGRMYVVEINARFGFSTLFYALYCKKDRFFDAIQGKKPLVMEEEKSDGDRRFLGKIKGIPGKSYDGLFNLSDIEKWYYEKGSFRNYYLNDEALQYGSFVGLFGETISANLDRDTAVAKFMDICLLRGKRMLSMYVDSYCGFEKECFNFDLIKSYDIKKRGDKFYCNKQKEMRFEGFWNVGSNQIEDNNVSSLTMMIGKNGSGKTTLMRLATKWISQLAIGVYPDEVGLIIFNTGDGQEVCISFSSGKSFPVDADPTLHILTDLTEIQKFLENVGILYYTETMTDLGLDILLPSAQWDDITKNKVFIDNSEVFEQSGYFSNFPMVENPLNVIRNRELSHTLKVWNAFGLEKVPADYIRINIKGITEKELRLYIKKEVLKHLDTDLSEEMQEELDAAILNIILLATNLSQRLDNYVWEMVLFWFMIGLVTAKLKSIFDTEIETNEDPLASINEVLSSMISTYNASDNMSWKTALMDINSLLSKPVKSKDYDFSDFIETIRTSNGQHLSSKAQDESMLFHLSELYEKENEKKALYKFLEIYSNNIISSVFSESVIIDVGLQSSGERNRTGLLASLASCKNMKKEYLICYLDEPDNSFHPAWKQTLVQELLETFGNLPFYIQAFISSHSPIMLSDAPCNAAVLFDNETMKNPNHEELNKASVRKVTRSPRHSTFGQQLYTLYYESFFMENGVIGSFAASKIQAVDIELSEIKDRIKKIKENSSIETFMNLEQRLNACERIIKLVDESIIGGTLRLKLRWCQRELNEKKR